jgi:hypothetical protein
VCDDCGVNKTFYTIESGNDVTFCTNFGSSIGAVDIVYEINSTDGAVNIQVRYNENLYETGYVTTGGTLTFEKSAIEVRTAEITIISTIGSSSVSMIERCPDALDMTVVQVCLTSNADSGQFIHNEYRYFEGPYTSPLQSTLVTFTTGAVNPIVSQYSSISGNQGTGAFPANLSNVRLLCNKIGFDNFVFNYEVNSFKYIRSNTLYGNNTTDINTLLSIATNAEPIIISGAPSTYYADFIMPTGSAKYLYLIYDYRSVSEIDLCYSIDTKFDACCNCNVNEIQACYSAESENLACCSCGATPAYEMNLCMSTVSCNTACTACV